MIELIIANNKTAPAARSFISPAYLFFSGDKSVCRSAVIVLYLGLLEENNNSSTLFKTDIRIVSNNVCEIGDNIFWGFSSGIFKGSSYEK